METKNETVDPLKGMTKEQRAELLARLQTEVKNDRMAKRESYEALRGQFMHDVLAEWRTWKVRFRASRNGLTTR